MSTPIQPTRPVTPYMGGKRNLSRRLCALIDTIDHQVYAEPFVGAGGIFLRRNSRPRAEFINDLGRDVYTLFRVLQEHYVAFLDLLRFQITTQAGFERLKATDPETLTDLQRAARFLYLQRVAFGGKVTGRSFGLSTDRPGRFNLTTLEPDLEALHERLAGVTVTCMDFEAFITRIDRHGALFYIDPPYVGCEGDYGPGFSPADHERLAQVLRGLHGRFVLSINDRPEIHDLYGGWCEIEPVSVTYTVSSKGAGRFGELIIQGGAS